MIEYNVEQGVRQTMKRYRLNIEHKAGKKVERDKRIENVVQHTATQ